MDLEAEDTSGSQVIKYLRTALKEGRDWPTALLEAVALWSVPSEVYRGREYTYLVDGEAFDWLLLAERLSNEVEGLIPEEEKEELLFAGRFPESFDESQFKDLLGADKYRGYQNYFYGVMVEEALQLAVEAEVHKRHLSNGNQYQRDFLDEAYSRIYLAPMSTLLKLFREEKEYPDPRSMNLSESTEFTYWLFKYRLRISDKARIASDTRKGVERLRQMMEVRHLSRLDDPTTVYEPPAPVSRVSIPIRRPGRPAQA